MGTLYIDIGSTSCNTGDTVTLSAFNDTADDIDVNIDDGGANGNFTGEFEGVLSTTVSAGETQFFDYNTVVAETVTFTATILNVVADVQYIQGQTLEVSDPPEDQPQNANISFGVTRQDEGYSVNISVVISDNGNGSVFQMTLDDDGHNGRFDWPFNAVSSFDSITITATEGQTYDFIYTLARPTLAGTAIPIGLVSDTVNGFFLSATYTNGTQNITATNYGRTGAFAAGF